MLKWGEEECKRLRHHIFETFKPRSFTNQGRWFFYITVIMTIAFEIGISLAVKLDNITLKAFFLVMTGLVFYRYQFILHDASHGTLVEHRKENHVFGNIAGYVVGYPFSLYKKNHSRHHIYTATEKDFELDNFLVENSKQKPSYQFTLKTFKSLLLLDLFQLIKNLFISKKSGEAQVINKLYLFLSVITQMFLLNVFNNTFSLTSFIEALLIFILSIGSITFTINRIRGMCEHSQSKDLEYYNFTRSHKKNILTFIIAPFNFNFHLEHHIFPEMPAGNYPKINKLLEKHFLNNDWISDSYILTIRKYYK